MDNKESEVTDPTEPNEIQPIEAKEERILPTESGGEEKGQEEPSLDMDEMIPEQAKVGCRVMGRIALAREDGYLVSIGMKTDAWLPGRDAGVGGQDLKQGDSLEVILVKSDDRKGDYIVSRRRLEETEAWKRALVAYESKEPLDCRVTQSTKGGIRVDMGGLEGFIPGSLIDDRGGFTNLQSLVGKSFRALVIEAEEDRRGKNLILSRKAWLRRQQALRFDRFAKNHSVGSKLVAVVSRLMTKKREKRPFAALLDCDGMELFLHGEEVAWEKVPLDKVLSPGQELEVVVIRLDNDQEQVSVSIKATLPDPWKDPRLEKGAWLDATITSLTKFGVFMDVGQGIQGLAHKSELSMDIKAQPGKVVKKGQQVRARVLGCDPIRRELSLTLLTEEESKKPRGESFGETFEGGTNLGSLLQNLQKKKG